MSSVERLDLASDVIHYAVRAQGFDTEDAEAALRWWTDPERAQQLGDALYDLGWRKR